MGKRAMEEMLLLDHQDRALSGKLAQMFMPLLQAALGKQLWEISTNRLEMSPHLRELLEALGDKHQSPGNVTAPERAFGSSARGGFGSPRTSGKGRESARGSHDPDEREEPRSTAQRPSKRKEPAIALKRKRCAAWNEKPKPCSGFRQVQVEV